MQKKRRLSMHFSFTEEIHVTQSPKSQQQRISSCQSRILTGQTSFIFFRTFDVENRFQVGSDFGATQMFTCIEWFVKRYESHAQHYFQNQIRAV